jgi:uncharacterized membrane protein YgaE (UPF0421/DUF939 family)
MELSSINIIHGFKTAVAATLAYLITILFNLEFGYWAVLSTVIVMQVYVADSIEMCLYRLTGTLSGAVIGAVVLVLIPKTYFFIGLALFVTIGICSFLTKYNTRYKMAAITVVIIVITGAHVENILSFALSRVTEICIGILCAFVVSVFIFPKRKIDVLKDRLGLQAKACSENCNILIKAFTSKQQNVDEALMDDLVKNVWENYIVLEKIRQHESLIYRKKFNENFSVKISLMSRSVEHLRNMARTLNSLGDEGHDIIMEKELEKLALECGNTLFMLIKNEFSSVSNNLEEIVTDLDIKLLNLRKEGLTRRFDSKRLVQVFSFYSSLIYFAEDIIAGSLKLRDQA